ncbi:MAG TPA: dihydroorotase family protein [Gaiellales bacterium]|jgi:allantoinase|nr:dihydroorotase family protein [Gaiellales bacterium]
MLDLVVRGRFALPGGRIEDGEIGIAQGRIAALAAPGELSGAERIDVPAGQLILPGHVDAHVHTGSAPGEGVERATASAAAGGVTTIIDMPYDDPEPANNLARFQEKAVQVEAEALVDVALYATIAPSGGLGEIAPLHAAGAAAFKASTFETHPVRFPRVPDGELLLAMEICAELGALVCFHPENDDIVRRLSRKLADEGRSDPMAHADARPPVAESEAIGRALELGLATGCRTHLCHVSVERGFALVARALADGAHASAETCTHYLVMDEDDLRRLGGRAKINPPLRPRAQQDALWRLLDAGCVDQVTSDHVGWARELKDTPDIFAARSGVPGLETTLPLLFSEGVVRRGLPLGTLLHVLCEGPAARYGLAPRKGAIASGADADLVIFDPGERWRIDERELICHAGWTPYHGHDVTGRVKQVLVRGNTVFAGGEVRARAGAGRVVRPVREREVG